MSQLKFVTKDMQKVWNNSYAHQRADLLRSVGITDDKMILSLANTQYVVLPSEIRFKLEVIQQ